MPDNKIGNINYLTFLLEELKSEISQILASAKQGAEQIPLRQLFDEIDKYTGKLINLYLQDKISEEDLHIVLSSLSNKRKHLEPYLKNNEYLDPLQELKGILYILKTIYAVSTSTIDTSSIGVLSFIDHFDPSSITDDIPMAERTQEARTTGETPAVIPIPLYEKLKELDQVIEDKGIYEGLPGGREGTRARLLQTYLTTDKTFSDIQREEGFKSPEGVAKNVKQSLETIWSDLPKPIRDEYKSPKEAVRLKSGHHTESSVQRMQQGWERLRRQAQETGSRIKAEFSETHRQHITDANLQRWERERAARRAAQTEEQD